MVRYICAGIALLLPSFLHAADDAGTEMLIKLSVQPMALPKPAMKYALLPELRDMNPGNPIPGYLKCFMEQQNFFFNKQAIDNRELWQKMPLKDLPVEQLRGYGGSATRQADYAARLDTPDWQILLKLKSEGVSLLLPEVQQLRMLAGALKVRLRGDIADGRFDDAIHDAQTMFSLARHLGEHPTMISSLVGFAIAALTIDPLQEMVGQPGAPNLYWAFADLPKPLIDMRKGTQGERLFSVKEFALIRDDEPMSPAQLEQAVARIRELLKLVEGPGSPSGDVGAWIDQRAQDEGYVTAARKRLVDFGLSHERVKKFPPIQVVLLDEKRELEVRRDDIMKAMNLPYWQAEAVSGKLWIKDLANQGKPKPLLGTRSRDLLFSEMVPAAGRVRRAQARIEQRLALLTCIEAIRAYAAEHGGTLPAKLDDIGLPLPVDPFNGKPFRHRLDGATAHLQGSPPAGEEKTPIYNLHFEITVQK